MPEIKRKCYSFNYQNKYTCVIHDNLKSICVIYDCCGIKNVYDNNKIMVYNYII